ncbi:transcriptional regulator, TetR family [Desulfatibacillum aliphaticivorans]|uniref:Transcriptional regulator, TetR family n=1 Tax=Desulfatibacillum aliphaticivorans TaxID=218208 RepID=B8FL96_DESAL|nr:TetR/AcrR family transcriptional regulator [Desulfatibacillum aliphaticivorans]ACL05042.1 transcriptional regulator, TetR family [Desulfatibacillum aliphaticivorans]
MTTTKDRILLAAEELITANGIAETTIAKIAQKAEVADSLVYQYFKNKQDLLFSVASIKLEEALDLLAEQLEGIKDPESRLRKLIWYGLKYNDLNPGYARILLFECRSNADFYKTEAYRKIRKHAGIMTDILAQGVKDGQFRNDVNMGIIRDAVYGAMDFEAISCIAAGEIEKSRTDLEHLMNLILPMIKVRPDPPERDKRTRILLAAEKIFAAKGYNKAKMIDIAEEAAVSESAIYDYFKNKDDLLLAVPETRLKEHLESIMDSFDVKSPFAKLRRLIRYHFALYMINRDFLKVFLLHNQLNIQFYSSPAYKSYQKYLNILDKVVEEGQNRGDFRQDVSLRVFRNVFIGAFSHMALRWMIVEEGKNNDKMKEIDELIDLLLDAVSTPKKEAEEG